MRPAILVALFAFMACGNVFAQASTNPARYTTIMESTRRGRTIPRNSIFGEIDGQSLIEIQFDESKMALPLKESEDEVRQIEIRVQAFQTRNGVQTPIVPIDNYVSRHAARLLIQKNRRNVGVMIQRCVSAFTLNELVMWRSHSLLCC